MSKIKVLAPQEICKIAAGEVVERPANIVKELVENALDAGATQIEIYLVKAGKKAIRIVDNGCGMSPQDAKLCFEHHATSKITSISDLDTISSFGFRGEALSSIAAVSKIELITCERGASAGSQTILHAGQIIAQNPIASPIGTDILITDLFYNVPVRQKFLKQDDTEWRQIAQLFYAFVFDYHNIHFKLYHDDRLVYNCPPVGQLLDRTAQIWEANTASNLLELTASEQSLGLKISGFISNHQVFRYNRNQIFCFVNRRLVKNYSLSKAILKGYSNVLPQDRYPLAILLIDLPSTQVDINVHPRKEEVSFLHARKIESAITSAVKNSLQANLNDQIAKPKDFAASQLVHNFAFNKFKAAQAVRFDFDQDFNPVNNFAKQDNDYQPQVGVAKMQNQQSLQATFVSRDYEVVGQFKKTYILISNQDGLLLVDQHAAHERVLYEKFRAKFHEVVTVKLMFPIIVNLTPVDLESLSPYLPILQEHGIGIDVFGKNQLIISSTPTYLKQTKLDDLIHELVAWICEHQALDLELFTKKINEHLHAQMACKAAVKAGDVLNNQQMYELLDDLQKTDNRFTCPHGRPTMWSFSLDEIEKKFKRKT